MFASCRVGVVAFVLPGMALLVATGCGSVSSGKYTALESQSRILSEQNKAQLTEIENLKNHARSIEDQLIRAEQQIAAKEPKANTTDEAQLVASHKNGMAPGRPFAKNVSAISEETQTKLSALARRYKHLQYDPATGIGKLDTDVLFPSGNTQLKPEADRMLREFAHILQQPDAAHLKVMVVGHTDDAGPRGREVRSKYGNNWALSTARATAVAEKLKEAGLAEDRMGISGYADHQPIAPNDTVDSRSRNRRVEIFVVGPDTPVVGWTETHASVYE